MVTSVCSSKECTQRTVLYGSKTAVATWTGPNCEAELVFLAIIDRKTFQHEATETRSGTPANCVENHEPLEASAIVCQLSEAVKDQVDDLFANGVVTTGEVVGGIL